MNSNNQRLQALEEKINNIEKSKEGLVSLNNFISVQKGMLFFFLIISGNYIGELLSCRTQKLFTSSMTSKHIIALISLYFFVIISDNQLQKYNPLITLFGTLLIYVYFLCMAKAESSYFLISLVFLTLIAFTQVYKGYLENNKDNLTDLERNINNKIDLIQKIMIGIVLVLTTMGLLIYMGMKKTEYGSDFTYKLFFMGKPLCSDNLLGDLKNVKGLNKNIVKSNDYLKSSFFFIKKALTN